jgi:hypothetical protein
MAFPVARLLLVIKNVFHSQATTQQRLVTTTLYSLEDTINRRQGEIVTEGGGMPSWTKKLLLDAQLLCSKIRYIMLILNFVYGIIKLLINCMVKSTNNKG